MSESTPPTYHYFRPISLMLASRRCNFRPQLTGPNPPCTPQEQQQVQFQQVLLVLHFLTLGVIIPRCAAVV